jgi:hypothetical protein
LLKEIDTPHNLQEMMTSLLCLLLARLELGNIKGNVGKCEPHFTSAGQRSEMWESSDAKLRVNDPLQYINKV